MLSGVAAVGKTVMPRLLFVVNVDWFLISHRLPVALAAHRAGYEVHVATRFTGREEELRQVGFIVHSLPLERRSGSPITLVREFLALWQLMRKIAPDVVHLVTIKPVLLGGVAARLTNVRGVLAAISGLGTVFLTKGWRARTRRHAVEILYKIALGHRNLRVVVQNTDDMAMLQKMTGLPQAAFRLIAGAGIDTTVFFPTESRTLKAPVVMFAGRLLRDKGVHEFVDAARLLKAEGNGLAEVKFVLVGDVDPENHTSLSPAAVISWQSEGIIEWWGQRDDMAATLNQADIVVLPSYREGMPKVLLEAAACGVPVVTSDVPGCRDALRPDVTGLLAQVGDSHSLAKAIKKLLLDPGLRSQMGVAGRILAEDCFRIESVVEAHLDIYKELRRD